MGCKIKFYCIYYGLNQNCKHKPLPICLLDQELVTYSHVYMWLCAKVLFDTHCRKTAHWFSDQIISEWSILKLHFLTFCGGIGAVRQLSTQPFISENFLSNSTIKHSFQLTWNL